MQRILTTAVFFLSAFIATAQSNAPVRDDKLMVVVATLVIIFLGLAAYLFAVDRKISKFERKSKKPD